MNITPIKQIRRKCLDCSGNSTKEVKDCPIFECPLYLYRYGRRFTAKEQRELKDL